MKVLMPKKYQERVINRLFFRGLARHHVSGVSQAMENKRTAGSATVVAMCPTAKWRYTLQMAQGPLRTLMRQLDEIMRLWSDSFTILVVNNFTLAGLT